MSSKLYQNQTGSLQSAHKYTSAWNDISVSTAEEVVAELGREVVNEEPPQVSNAASAV